MKGKKNSKVFILVFLGMLTAFGPFVTDMYLPTLPAMSEYFHTTSSMVQLGLTASMIGLAAGQLLFGPLSDKYGRRLPLIISMILFAVATIGCIYSYTIMQFVGWRLIQGIAGAGGIISRSVAADKYSGRELAKMLALIGAINGVAPVAAPMGGGFLAGSVGWTGIFWCLFVLGIILLLGSIHFEESLPVEDRKEKSWRSVFRSFIDVLRNSSYVCYTLQFGFAQGVLFANIASAPFIMQQHCGFSPLMFSICFGINAIFIVISAASAIKFRRQEQALHYGSTRMVVVSALLLVALVLDCNFWIYELLLIGLLSMLGLTFTASNTLTMDCEHNNAGMASALLGALEFAFGGIVSPLVGLGYIMVSTGIIFLKGSICSYVCTRYALHRNLKTVCQRS
ncbi:multidrug effflux MFS transporter [Phocaeicola coprocola]|uniref:multidrug effflux MFS transporter n=1 Tax=Phocaeicola coprocola TaxID=310298 RepID=UPI0029429B3B|nr:multidrug effflux MFS transporter [Phocaeicola coprocola]